VFLEEDKYKEEDDEAGEDDDDDDKKENIVPDLQQAASKKPRIVNNPFLDSFSNGLSRVLAPRSPWMPWYNMAVWRDENLRPIVTIMVSFDGGVDIVNDITLTIPEHGMHIEVKVKCIDRMSQLVHAHDYFISRDKNCLPKFHPRVVAFHDYFQSIKAKQHDEVYGTCIIKLPFPVQIDPAAEHRFEDAKGPRVLYVDLRSIQENTYMEKEKLVSTPV
jgi:hypothetical protein